MRTWKLWKSGFDRWEKTTSEYLDRTIQSPVFLAPTASLLKVAMKTKSGADRAMGLCWKTLGLTNRDDQDLAFHRINQLEGRILDLEEELRELRD